MMIIVHSDLELLNVRGIIKKFVDWCDEINTY